MTTTLTWPSQVNENRESPVVENQGGIWGEEISQDEGLRRVTFRRPLPIQLIQQYAEVAVRHANIRRDDDGDWFADIEGFQGVWAKEASAAELVSVLREVVFEWVLLKIQDADRDMPVLESLDLNEL